MERIDLDEAMRQLSGGTQNCRQPITNSHSGLKFIKKCLVIAVCTQNHNWNEAEYQRGVIVPLQKVKQLFAKLEEERREPGVEEVREALRMVVTVLKTKRISPHEKLERMGQLARMTGSPEIRENIREQLDG